MIPVRWLEILPTNGNGLSLRFLSALETLPSRKSKRSNIWVYIFVDRVPGRPGPQGQLTVATGTVDCGRNKGARTRPQATRKGRAKGGPLLWDTQAKSGNTEGEYNIV